MRIALYGSALDLQVSKVEMEAVARGHHVCRVTTEGWFGNGSEGHSIRIGRDGVAFQFGVDRIDDVDAAWIRHLVPPFPNIDPDPLKPPFDRDRLFVEVMHARERATAVMSSIDLLIDRGVPLINHPASGLGIQNKPSQLHKLQRAGVPVPETIVSDDPAAVRAFAEGRRVVFKPAAGGALVRELDEAMLDALELIQKSPVIFQELVPGDDVRVTIVDDRIVSAVVVEVPEGTLDFRSDTTYAVGRGTYREVQLTPKQEEALRASMIALGLRFAGIDVRVDPKEPGAFKVLEANPSPTYYDIERKMNHPISRAIVEALERG